MSKLDDIINNLCTNGVPYKFLGDVAQIGTGSSNGNEAEESGDYPFFIRSQTVKSKSTYEYDEEAIIIPGEGGIGEIFHYINGKYALHQRVYRIHFTDKQINTRFAFYYMNAFFKRFILRKAVSATVTSIRKPMIESFLIPIPPLSVQEEIVRVLDGFTNLIVKLTEELTARKKQYEYYRDKVLNFDENTKILQLADCILKTENIKWKNSEGTYKYIDLSSVDRDNHTIVETTIVNKDTAPSRAQQIVSTNDILFGGTRPMLKRSCMITEDYDGQVCSTGFCVLRANTNIVLPRWIYFMISTENFYKHVELYQKGASYPAITDADVKKYEIPIPSIEEQRKIILLLDEFETLCNDITNGLPAEIEARQKQYEYYRDKLLTFKRLEV